MAKLQIFLPDGTQISHDLTDEKTTVGRVADNILQIDDASVSGRHAEILHEADAFHLHDLGSTNGTFLNGEQVTDAVLRHADEIRFGVVESVFHGKEEVPDQPLPESTVVTAAVAHLSVRPPKFVSSSPIPKIVRKKDPVAMALYAAAAAGVLGFVAATVIIMKMAAPGF
ncbi:MAG: FHA domain-containing protein [Verrucomicrobiae bacterium]